MGRVSISVREEDIGFAVVTTIALIISKLSGLFELSWVFVFCPLIVLSVGMVASFVDFLCVDTITKRVKWKWWKND